MSEPVIKTILPAIFLSSLLISTAFALPFSPTSHEQTATIFTDVGYYDKNYHKQQKKYYKQKRSITINTTTAAVIMATDAMLVHPAGKP